MANIVLMSTYYIWFVKRINLVDSSATYLEVI